MAPKSSQSTVPLKASGRKKPSVPVTGVTGGRFIVNSRCFVGAYRKTYASVVKPHHQSIIRRTIFGNILHFPDITSDRPMLEYILRHWKRGVVFEIGPREIRFTAQEVAVLLGLPLSGSAIDLGLKGESHIQRRYLEGKKVDRKNLEVVLRELSPSQDKDDITDFVKLLILYFFCCILFTNTNNLCPKGLVGIVDDLPRLEGYNWPEAVHRLIIDSLSSAANKLQANSKRVGYVLGCTPLLPVWIYEHTGYRSPPPSRLAIFPRIQRWDTIRWSRRSRGSSRVKEDFHFTSCRRRLDLSPEEQRLVGVVDEVSRHRRRRNEDPPIGYKQVMAAIGRLESVVYGLVTSVTAIMSHPALLPAPQSSSAARSRSKRKREELHAAPAPPSKSPARLARGVQRQKIPTAVLATPAPIPSKTPKPGRGNTRSTKGSQIKKEGAHDNIPSPPKPPKEARKRRTQNNRRICRSPYELRRRQNRQINGDDLIADVCRALLNLQSQPDV